MCKKGIYRERQRERNRRRKRVRKEYIERDSEIER